VRPVGGRLHGDAPIFAVEEAKGLTGNVQAGVDDDGLPATFVRRGVVGDEDLLVGEDPREGESAGLRGGERERSPIPGRLAKVHPPEPESRALAVDAGDVGDAAVDATLPVQGVAPRIVEVEHRLADVLVRRAFARKALLGAVVETGRPRAQRR